MSRLVYGLIVIAILISLGIIVILTSFLAIQTPLSDHIKGANTASEILLFSAFTFVWWLASAPIWTWATVRRHQQRGVP